MEKNNKTLKAVILTAIISILLTGSIGVVALTLYADDIIYTPANTNWKIDNAESALNDLYVLTNNKLTENYNNGYNAGVAAGKPTKTQTGSTGCGAGKYEYANCPITFSNLTEVVGISNIKLSGDVSMVITNTTISGNTVTLRAYNGRGWSTSDTFTVTAIGY